jgi:mRNA interferase YafQ
MRTIEYTTQFKRDYKREINGKHKAVFSNLFVEIIDTLARDEPLAAKHRDHALSNHWQDHRDCHVKPDLVLIYRKPDMKTLQLVRLGSHSELSL